jgi:hypothetical protein
MPRHLCEFSTSSAMYGGAIYQCFENEKGELWVNNDEYESQVNYCPFCGYKAIKQAVLQDNVVNLPINPVFEKEKP